MLILRSSLEKEEYCQGDIRGICPSNRPTPRQRQQLQPPTPGSHPVIFAQRLLTLALRLQGASAPGDPFVEQLSVDRRDLLDRIVDTARRLVNSNDAMVSSVEGINSIAMEGLCYANMGDIRRAWLTMRRAMLVAQTMGVHRQVCPPSAHGAAYGSRSDAASPASIWFALVHLDRYFSLVLGLPQCSSESIFATPSELAACESEERLRRLDCASAGLILQQMEMRRRRDDEYIQETDRMLQEAAGCMPAKWWASLHGSCDTDAQAARIKDQLRHFHILCQLHLPHLIDGWDNSEHDGSRLTAVYASREALVRYIALQASNSMGPFRLGIQIVSVMSTMALCIAHIGAGNTLNRGTHLASLLAQRLGDRGLMERALEGTERMEASSSPNADKGLTLGALRKLLDIDADAASGVRYCVREAPGAAYSQSELSYEPIDDGMGMCMTVPSVGPIVIERLQAAPDFAADVLNVDAGGGMGLCDFNFSRPPDAGAECADGGGIVGSTFTSMMLLP